jgi:hypothetical protein
MYKPSTYLVVTYFPTYLPIYDTYFLQNWLPRLDQISVEVHTQLTNTRHPVDGVLVDAGSLWPWKGTCVSIHAKQTSLCSTGHCNFASWKLFHFFGLCFVCMVCHHFVVTLFRDNTELKSLCPYFWVVTIL